MPDDLIAKLEAATEGSRELDIEIAAAVGIASAYYSDNSGVPRAPDHSTSLDAKLPDEEIVEVCRTSDGMWWARDARMPTEKIGFIAHTEPLARRCAALVASHIAQEPATK